MNGAAVEIAYQDASTWTHADSVQSGEAGDWRAVDRALRSIARRQAALDAEEARWLREAERLQIWRPLGMVNAIDYIERVLGYAPRTAQERLRVARALGELPVIGEALSAGELSFSAVRELTRVATPATEAAWRDAARGKNLRQIEELVADHASGSMPDDPPELEARRHTVRFELSSATSALLRQTRLALDEEHGSRLDDDELIAALCTAALERTPEGESSGRAKYQIALTVCPRCDRAAQEGAGVRVPVDAATLDRARCDAQHIGSIDGEAPERAHQDIPPSTVRFVWRRDGGRCQTPGCRSARGLEVHHIVRRADGGSHEPCNLRLQCSRCHAAIHAGTLIVTGAATGELEAERPGDQGAHVGADAKRDAGPKLEAAARLDAAGLDAAARLDAAVKLGSVKSGAAARLDAAVARAEARDALVGLGWRPGVARAAVDAAGARVGPAAPLETLIREALRSCPKARAPSD